MLKIIKNILHPSRRDLHTHYSRVSIYESEIEIEQDSDTVAVVELNRSFQVQDIPNIDETFIIHECNVLNYIKGRGPQKIRVRQFIEMESESLLNQGNKYLLYLTYSGLNPPLEKDYYITGVTAGIYREIPFEENGSLAQDNKIMFVRNIVTEDNLPGEIQIENLN
ncbi:hypothetical protein QM007_09975 [Rothia sp. SD9660Na]|uniref:hypothetical protein n=1 Tax=Rothia sp. SD9660Na TaxID=3047030 RepID=UPI0024B95EC4|nr:hypothetical protein [Rothia sp. SD9660Na]WHS50227.1 hypothetical protein QM007_09975 [Rothia sp. SD9660Na]